MAREKKGRKVSSTGKELVPTPTVAVREVNGEQKAYLTTTYNLPPESMGGTNRKQHRDQLVDMSSKTLKGTLYEMIKEMQELNSSARKLGKTAGRAVRGRASKSQVEKAYQEFQDQLNKVSLSSDDIYMKTMRQMNRPPVQTKLFGVSAYDRVEEEFNKTKIEQFRKSFDRPLGTKQGSLAARVDKKKAKP